MARNSKFYRITNLVLIEYCMNQYAANNLPDVEKAISYYVYTGLDDNVYFSEIPDETENIDYKNPLYFIKLPDRSDSEYKFVGFNKNDNGKYTNQNFLKDFIENSKYVKAFTKIPNDNIVSDKPMCYDTIRLHFIYGFILNGLAGLSLQVKTQARYLGPTLNIVGYNHLETDDYGNPVFKKISDLNGNKIEPLSYQYIDFILLDYFFPKECLNFDNVVHYHKVPLYQNGAYYDRYIEIKVPSAYYMSLNGANIPLYVKNPYGLNPALTRNYIESHDNYVYYQINDDIFKLPKFTDPKYIKYYEAGLYSYLPQYNIPGKSQDRVLTYNIIQDPKLEINFATVQEDNLKTIYTLTPDNEVQVENYFSARSNTIKYRSIFHQDPINTISLAYNTNSDYFNAVIFEDTENMEIVYYPTFGDGDNSKPLDYEIMAEIESGSIPMLTEGFYDGLENIDLFTELYGENAFKWVIYNDLSIQYNYAESISSLTSTDTVVKTITLHFTNILDYTQYEHADYEFYKGHFVPRPLLTLFNNEGSRVLVCKSILISYTCRLVNRLTNVEAIRNATLTIKDPTIYEAKKVNLKNIVTYKIFNKTTKDVVNPRTIIKESHDKYIRSYYDATNLVVKDMGTNSLYTQGQMILLLKRSSTNYLFRLYTLNQDNVRVPYDLTGPYRYLLTFPALDGSKIKILPNKDNLDVQLGIGLLVFYITEQQVKRIMAVPASERYFAITTDTDSDDSQVSTLYEGKVAYYT